MLNILIKTTTGQLIKALKLYEVVTTRSIKKTVLILLKKWVTEENLIHNYYHTTL